MICQYNELIADNKSQSVKGNRCRMSPVRHYRGTLCSCCHLRPMRSLRFHPLQWHSEHISCCPRWCGTHEIIHSWPRCWRTYPRLAEAWNIYFNQPFTKEWALKCEIKSRGAWHESGVVVRQLEFGSKSHWDTWLLSSLSNKAVTKGDVTLTPVCLQNTVSVACCPRPCDIAFFWSPS